MTARKKQLTAEELDALHDSGASMDEHLDLQSARRPGLEIQRVNVDFPVWMIESLDKEAGRLAIPRQAVIKFWISQRLEEVRRRRANETSEPTATSGRGSS